jgi:hypothetical protein
LGCSVFALRGFAEWRGFGGGVAANFLFWTLHFGSVLPHIQGVLSLCLFLDLVPVMDEFNPYFFASA